VTAQLDQIDLSSLEPGYNRNPHPIYHELRELPVRPVVLFGLPMWFITGYEEARSALADPRIKHDRVHATPEVRERGPWLFSTEQLGFNRYMLSLDPPDHTRLKTMVNKVFTPRRVNLLRPRITEIAVELITRAQATGRMEMVEDFAYPLPMTVITEMLGVPPDEDEPVRAWANAFSSVGAQSKEEIVAGFIKGRDYFVEVFKRKQAEVDAGRVDPEKADLLTGLAAVHQGTDRLDLNELLAMVFQLLVGGFETTANMLSTGMLALLQNPDQLELVRQRPDLRANIVEEVIRYDAPVKNPWFRFATEDVELGGAVIPAGSVVAVNLAAANRDPRRFADPDRFDITRPDANAHLGFSHGPHFCFGAPLARAEGEIGFTELATRLPDVRLAVPAAELTYRPSPSMRCLTALPLEF
jgi:cytochrome P450